MIALPRTSTGRIVLAIALSALVHAIALFAPLVKLPPVEAPLPPLTAKLEPLPKIAAKPVPPREPKPKPRPAPLVPKEAPPDNQPTENVRTEEPQIDAEPQPPAIDKAAEEVRPAHPLPKHAQLIFTAYKGTDFAIGEARHRLEIGDDKSYTLRIGMNTTGLASIFKTYESDQQSSGTLTAQGLRPGKFSEAKNTSNGKESLEAKFSWEEKVLSFSNGHSMPLPEQTQDIISFLYQLSQLALDNGAISMYISNGKKLERYELTVGEEEMIQTRLGRLRALPLHKVHAQGEEGLDIWLGLEYRLLPVKIRMIDRSGQIAGEMVISEIRVADE
ncbi:MAG: DUF3108 domain-containing protein [Gallionella sp.]|nr:DUF3108 domain-containing protein [Gallionella sp.]